MNSVINYRETVLKELKEIPEEFFPFILEQIKSYKKKIRGDKTSKQSPVNRILKLSGTLENPGKLNAKQYKQKVVEEYLSTSR